ncbi:Hypothetical predicted protein [Octopus vulgaris]|uniref:Uncharacterized protein n=1 Tax=Octopus vulgaris TaxID=6645 RepID=A0AA36ANM3_OCTVU|nr:Hypothetical predicted protein [Octopus vulgaris]
MLDTKVLIGLPIKLRIPQNKELLTHKGGLTEVMIVISRELVSVLCRENLLDSDHFLTGAPIFIIFQS